jgi:hypothetical protein
LNTGAYFLKILLNNPSFKKTAPETKTDNTKSLGNEYPKLKNLLKRRKMQKKAIAKIRYTITFLKETFIVI